MLGLAVVLAIIGATLLIFGAIHPTAATAGIRDPPPDFHIPANYTLNYIGIAILVSAIATALASSKSKPHTTTIANITN